MNTQREHAQQLLNHLAPHQVDALVHVMEVMLDPLSRKLAVAPVDDEPFTERDRQAVAEADGWLQLNQPIPWRMCWLTLASPSPIGKAWPRLRVPRRTAIAMAKRVAFTDQAMAEIRIIPQFRFSVHA